jgi:hypothetical protein
MQNKTQINVVCVLVFLLSAGEEKTKQHELNDGNPSPLSM